MIGNRVTESDIREWLNENGYNGQSAKFGEVELHAIRRPGWRQIFRFDCKVSFGDGDSEKLWGALKNDETKTSITARTSIVVFPSKNERTEQLDLWVNELNLDGGGAEANWYSVGAIAFLGIAIFVVAAIVRRIFL